jgi:hypothetical protein
MNVIVFIVITISIIVLGAFEKFNGMQRIYCNQFPRKPFHTNLVVAIRWISS